MPILIRKATESDLDAIEQLYDDLTDHLATQNINYPNWKKGVYPLRCDAEEGLQNSTLYVAERTGEIVGTVIYLRDQGEPYRTADWQLPFDIPVIVLHILAVHPAHQGTGVGRALMDYAEHLARQAGARAVRLDTHVNNLPACRLYEKCGYRYCGLVDLGLEPIYGPEFKWYRTYEKLIK